MELEVENKVVRDESLRIQTNYMEIKNGWIQIEGGDWEFGEDKPWAKQTLPQSILVWLTGY